MLTVLFLVALAILVAGAVRRPATRWQRAAVAAAAILLIAVLVAWGLEYLLQSRL